MAVKKLSEINLAGGPPLSTDTVVGVASGPTDERFTIAQIASTVGKVVFPPAVDTGIVYYPALANNFSITLPSNVWHVVFNGTMVIPVGTMTMPAAPIDGQVVRVKTEQDIEAFTVLGNVGQTVVSFPAVFPRYTYFEATWDAALSTWYVEYVAGSLINLEDPLTLYIAILAGTIVGGSGYVSASYTSVPLTGGSGSGAQANINVIGGVVTDVITTVQGTGYVIGDVLSASNSNLGGSGSGFTFTLTGIGTDLHEGTTIGTAFRTFGRAFNAIAAFNLATGFSVTVNVSDGIYQEQVVINNYIGSIAGQITWLGNETKRENCQIKPNTNTVPGFGGQLGPIIQLNNSIGNVFRGFWLNGTDPGFQGWSSLSCLGGNNSAYNCRYSVPADTITTMFQLYTNGTQLTIGGPNGTTETFDQPTVSGHQAGLAVIGFGNGEILHLTQNSTFQLLSTAPDNGGNPFFEVNGGNSIDLQCTFSGWAGTLGSRGSFQNGASIQTLYADNTQIPGTSDVSFTGCNCAYGSQFYSAVNFTSGEQCFGIPQLGAFATAGIGATMPNANTWGMFHTKVGTEIYNFISFNDGGTAFHVPISTATTGYNYQTPATGFSITLGDKDGRAILDPAAGLATGTITFCPVPFDGQQVEVRTSQTITALTVSGNAGQSVKAAPTTLTAGTKFSAIYRSANTTWYCAT